MSQIFEMIMLICFGLSWPISVYKSYTTKSTKGKSLFFLIAIVVGYSAGIVGKIISGAINYVLFIYCFNLLVVLIDLTLFFINKKIEKRRIKINN